MKINYLKREKGQLPISTRIMCISEKRKIFNAQYHINIFKKSVS